MFTFMLLDPWPWDKGIEPDFKNEELELYHESSFTREIRTKYGSPFKPTEKWWVALVRFANGEKVWVISDGIGILEESSSIDDLGTKIDKWKLVMERQ